MCIYFASYAFMYVNNLTVFERKKLDPGLLAERAVQEGRLWGANTARYKKKRVQGASNNATLL